MEWLSCIKFSVFSKGSKDIEFASFKLNLPFLIGLRTYILDRGCCAIFGKGLIVNIFRICAETARHSPGRQPLPLAGGTLPCWRLRGSQRVWVRVRWQPQPLTDRPLLSAVDKQAKKAPLRDGESNPGLRASAPLRWPVGLDLE